MASKRDDQALMISAAAWPGAAARAVDDAIPFPNALEDAAVSVERLDSILDYALLVGNGDINALLYSEGGGLRLMLTKNDVWDARLDSKLDPPLPKLAWIKRATAESKAPSWHTTILESGWGQQGGRQLPRAPVPLSAALRPADAGQAGGALGGVEERADDVCRPARSGPRGGDGNRLA